MVVLGGGGVFLMREVPLYMRSPGLARGPPRDEDEGRARLWTGAFGDLAISFSLSLSAFLSLSLSYTHTLSPCLSPTRE